jgi:hypothetical protein
MSVVRRHHNSNFTVVPNAISEDARLSVEAKGVLGYLLSRPHDWTIRLNHIGATLGVGRDKTERIFQQLMDTGYVVRGKQRRVNGAWGPMEFVVLDDPARSSTEATVASLPHPEKPHAVEPSTAEPHAVFQGTYQVLSQQREIDTRARELSTVALDVADQCFRAISCESGDLVNLCGLHYEIQRWITAGHAADVLVQAFAHVIATRGKDKPLTYVIKAVNSFLLDRQSAPPTAATPRTRGRNGTARNGGFIRNAMRLATEAATDG